MIKNGSMIEAEYEQMKASICKYSVEKLQVIRCDRRKG
jgi:hypothetical protein